MANVALVLKKAIIWRGSYLKAVESVVFLSPYTKTLGDFSKKRKQMAPISLTLLLLTVAVSFYGFSNENVQRSLLHHPYTMARSNQYYRLLTSGFVHAGWMHLGFNMLTFFFFATVVETAYAGLFGETLGRVLFVAMYLVAIILADLPSFFKYRDQPHYSSLGASGGVSAIVFAYILLAPTNEICLYGLLCLPGFIWGLIYVGYSYYQAKNSQDNINHSAHLYGALFGFVFTLLLDFSLLGRFTRLVSNWIF